jgi:8-amino-3,8-dideoxy-alpha-D-manno-octulosonate transaminase
MQIDHEEEQAVLDVLRTKRLFRYYGPAQGPSKVAELEKAFSGFMGTRHGLGVTSGTAALICALAGLGIGPGDEVIIPAYTWIATASAVVALGAVPIIAEVDDSLTLDPQEVERCITPYTKAVIPVHMRGAPCRMDAIVNIARKHNLKVLEDTAQAIGASYRGKRLGSIGDAGAFSLQFNKIITSGEGGMVITNDLQTYQKAVMFHDVIGGLRNQIPENQIFPGVNFRMPELLGAVALVQLHRLDSLLAAMRIRKQMLMDHLSPVLKRKGIFQRTINDAAGDAAICLILYLPEASLTQPVARALEAEGLPIWVLYSPEAVDYHVYAHWSPILGQHTWTPNGGPWKTHPRKIAYSTDMCPRTLDFLSRAIHLDISPNLENNNLEEIAEAVYKVVNSLV